MQVFDFNISKQMGIIPEFMPMKKIFYLLPLLVACNSAPDMNAAKSCAEAYLSALKAPDFEKASQYYSSSYGQSGSEDRITKMKKLNDLMGNVVSDTMLIAGVLLAHGMTGQQLLLAGIVPALLAAGSLTAMSRLARRTLPATAVLAPKS